MSFIWWCKSGAFDKIKIRKILNVSFLRIILSNPEYVRLVTQISDLWENAKNKAALAINTELLDANGDTRGRYPVTHLSIRQLNKEYNRYK